MRKLRERDQYKDSKLMRPSYRPTGRPSREEMLKQAREQWAEFYKQRNLDPNAPVLDNNQKQIHDSSNCGNRYYTCEELEVMRNVP